MRRLSIAVTAGALLGLLVAAGLRHVAVHEGAAGGPPSAIDIGFAQFMSLHHEQAIAMSQLLLDGRPTGLQRLAQGIAYAQLLEQGEMQGWLRIWDAPLKPRSRSMTWMLTGPEPPGPELREYLLECERSPTGMPGLAPMTELAKLRQLEGRDRDRRFLELMQAHHAGGLPMARFAAEFARHAVVRERARLIVLEQSEELDRIRRTLAVLDQLPAP